MGWFADNGRIAELCRRSGNWYLANRNGDLHSVYAVEGLAQEIRIDHRPGFTVYFEAELPIRFSLEQTPSGLFARVLMRSVPLGFASWRMDIRHSCEASLFLSAQIPERCLPVKLFDALCREMRDEVLSFHQELRDKFRYQAAGAMAGRFAAASPSSEGIRFVEPVRATLGGQSRPMLGDGDNARR